MFEGCQYWPDQREGQYIIPRAEYFPILPNHSKCNNIWQSWKDNTEVLSIRLGTKRQILFILWLLHFSYQFMDSTIYVSSKSCLQNCTILWRLELCNSSHNYNNNKYNNKCMMHYNYCFNSIPFYFSAELFNVCVSWSYSGKHAMLSKKGGAAYAHMYKGWGCILPSNCIPI